MESRIICMACGGWLIEDTRTGEMDCDTCKIRILFDGTIDKSDCEEEMLYKINEQVFVNNILCEISDIIEEDNVIYFEVYPIDFNSIPRIVTSEQIYKKGV